MKVSISNRKIILRRLIVSNLLRGQPAVEEIRIYTYRFFNFVV